MNQRHGSGWSGSGVRIAQIWIVALRPIMPSFASEARRCRGCLLACKIQAEMGLQITSPYL